MEEEKIQKIYKIVDAIKITEDNEVVIEEIREALDNGDYVPALQKLKELTKKESNETNLQSGEESIEETEGKDIINDETGDDYSDGNNDEQEIYSGKLNDTELECIYIGLLLGNPKIISRYYFTYKICLFKDENFLDIYKSVLFTEGQEYASEDAKQDFNFGNSSEILYDLKKKIKEDIARENYDIEKIYLELKKIFVLRKEYLQTPVKEVQEKIAEITNYKLYDKMSIEEIENAIEQVNVTGKFKRAILNEGLTSFLKQGDNNLANGLALPFPILSSVFKGIRLGETMSFAMPSNSGKSRFTINLAAYAAFVHKKKVLIISNEMSEEKMRLCLITTIINNPEIQKIHGQKITKTEGELLEFKFKPDKGTDVEVDSDNFILKREKETHKDFVKRLSKVSTEFNHTITVTDWINRELNNSIYFINITDHTNDELRKVIMNYYYKEKIEYIFYDTLKTDTANIGNGEELKKTATILSNLAQNFNIYICSTLQLTETDTLPINLSINDLAVSRTVKEVLDTLCLIKQITRDNYDMYEYSLKEVDNTFYDLEKFDDPDVRYYACVVDKNRAGAKPKLVFRLNLAYNSWEELGYLRLKQ